MLSSEINQLKSLSLRYARKLTEKVVEGGLGPSTLEHLRLDNCPLTDKGLASIGAHHPRLRTLQLTQCEELTVVGLVNLLERLEIDGFGETDDFLNALEQLCPRLRHLRVRPCSSMKLESFAMKRPAVKLAYIDWRCYQRGIGIRHVSSKLVNGGLPHSDRPFFQELLAPVLKREFTFLIDEYMWIVNKL